MKELFFLEHNMDTMARYPDKYFDLAVVDPPYGLMQNAHRANRRTKLAESKNYHPAIWQQPKPDKAYFDELFRVSKNQIVWGANHFISQMAIDSPCWLVWDKDNTGNFADCELAWTSFDISAKLVKVRWNGMLQYDMANKEDRIHPCQKPVRLYDWIFHKFAKPGYKVLDTHLGSASSAISAFKSGKIVEFVASEIEIIHYGDAYHRYRNETKILKELKLQNGLWN